MNTSRSDSNFGDHEHLFEVEELEARRMLAGQVTASLHGSELRIVGDRDANDIILQQNGDGIAIVSGPDTTFVPATSVFTGVAKIRIHMCDGDDQLTIQDVMLDGKIRVNAGKGADRITSVGVQAESLRVRGKTGELVVGMDQMTVRDGFAVNGKKGNANVAISQSQVDERLKLQFGTGDLKVLFHQTTLNGDVVSTQRGGDHAITFSDGTIVSGDASLKTKRFGDSKTNVEQASEILGSLTVSEAKGGSVDVVVSSDSTVGLYVGPSPKITKNILFRRMDGVSLKADIYVPPAAGPRPAMLLIHGGFFTSGDKSDMTPHAEYFASLGFTVVSINYRLAPDHQWPLALHDAKAAVRWMRENADKYKIDPENIVAHGFSAGAQLALMLGTTVPADGFEGPGVDPDDPASTVQVVIAAAARTNFQNVPLTSSRFVSLFGGTRAEVPELYEEASPIEWVSAGDATTFFYIGEDDNIVSVPEALEMHQELLDAGVTSQFLLIPDEGHLESSLNMEAWHQGAQFVSQELGVVLQYPPS